MKKHVTFFTIALFIGFSIASCTKIQTCSCDIVYDCDDSFQEDYPVNGTKSANEKECADLENHLQSVAEDGGCTIESGGCEIK